MCAREFHPQHLRERVEIPRHFQQLEPPEIFHVWCNERGTKRYKPSSTFECWHWCWREHHRCSAWSDPVREVDNYILTSQETYSPKSSGLICPLSNGRRAPRLAQSPPYSHQSEQCWKGLNGGLSAYERPDWSSHRHSKVSKLTMWLILPSISSRRLTAWRRLKMKSSRQTAIVKKFLSVREGKFIIKIWLPPEPSHFRPNLQWKTHYIYSYSPQKLPITLTPEYSTVWGLQQHWTSNRRLANP